MEINGVKINGVRVKFRINGVRVNKWGQINGVRVKLTRELNKWGQSKINQRIYSDPIYLAVSSQLAVAIHIHWAAP